MTWPKNVRDHWNRVAALECLITSAPATIHHVHGRSVGARLVELGMCGTKGLSQRGYSDALVIPLSADLHYLGSKSIDGGKGVDAWESEHGSQAEMVDEVSRLVGYSLWELHRQWFESPKSKRRYGTT